MTKDFNFNLPEEFELPEEKEYTVDSSIKRIEEKIYKLEEELLKLYSIKDQLNRFRDVAGEV